jgi:hypothetical protein
LKYVDSKITVYDVQTLLDEKLNSLVFIDQSVREILMHDIATREIVTCMPECAMHKIGTILCEHPLSTASDTRTTLQQHNTTNESATLSCIKMTASH